MSGEYARQVAPHPSERSRALVGMLHARCGASRGRPMRCISRRVLGPQADRHPSVGILGHSSGWMPIAQFVAASSNLALALPEHEQQRLAERRVNKLFQARLERHQVTVEELDLGC